MSTDAFDLLGLQPAYGIDETSLRRAFLRKAAEHHPDVRVEGGEDAEDATAALTAARAALADPLQRAEVLLGRLGGPGKEREKTLPEGFLVYIMGVREDVEADVAAGGEGARAKWQEWGRAKRGEHEQTVLGLFERHSQTGDQAVLSEIRRELNAWRYIERLLEQLSPGYDPSRADLT